VQKFLNEVNSDCQISKTNMNLKPDHDCLLRHGVEKSPKQSFIACIAMTMFYDKTYLVPDPDKPGKNKSVPLIRKFIKDSTSEVPTIQQMKKIILNAIDIDKFIIYQNGDLITSFANPKLDMEKQVKTENLRKEGVTEREAEREREVEVEGPNRFVKGEHIECNYRGLDKWYKGVIINVNRNDTYDISFGKIKVNIDDYKDSELYRKIDDLTKKNNQWYKIKPSIEPDEKESTIDSEKEDITYDLEFFEKVVEAYENFKRFLTDKNIFIDYTYLWDIICIPNPLLFEKGLNLVVLEMPEDDITNNIDLACPTNHYSAHRYVADKQSVILLKRDNWFEPIYLYNSTGNKGKPKIKTTFSPEHDRQLPIELQKVFEDIIKPQLKDKDKCGFNLSLDKKEYRFKTPPLLDELITKLIARGYDVKYQVLNFQGKVIGVNASKEGKHGFIPCYPSSLTLLKPKDKPLDKYGYVFMTDDIWQSYEDTLAFLKDYYKYEEPTNIDKVQCFDDRYFCKVADSEMDGTLVIGFLTNTNQFIQINKPKEISHITDNIKIITSNDTLVANIKSKSKAKAKAKAFKPDGPLVADINTLTSSKADSRRVDFIKRIQLETNFYNVFRNTIRILFNDYSNSEQRKKIQEECKEKTALYKDKLTKVIKSLKTLVNDNVEFVEEFNYKNINEDDIQSCIANKADNCIETDTSICKISTKNGKCIISFPSKNLVTDMPNEEYYFGRMADELIRYNRIKSFIFKPQAYLSFGKIKYNLRDDEIIVLQDMLTQEFFDNMKPSDINIYAKYNTYDNAEPIISKRYTSDVPLDELINPKIKDCNISEPEKITNKYWKLCFPNNYKEIIYKDSKNCGLYLIIDLVKAFTNKTLTINTMKEDLIDEYRRLITENESQAKASINLARRDKILDIIKCEGQVDSNKLLTNVEEMIMPEKFTPVSFDLWILLNKYEIPSFFISDYHLLETNRELNRFVCYQSKDNNYAFIVVPSMRQGKKILPEYKLIINETANAQINISDLPQTPCLDKLQNAIKAYYTIEYFIDNIFDKQLACKPPTKAAKIKESRDIVGQNPDILDIPEEEEDQHFDIEPVVQKKTPRKSTKKKGGRNISKNTRRKWSN
jgi:hypothetical protein